MRRVLVVLLAFTLGFVACGESTREDSRERNTTANWKTTGCTDAKVEIVAGAFSDAETLSADADAYFAAERSASRYSTWFGSYEPARWTKLQSQVKAIRAILTTKSLTIGCDSEGCSAGTFGFTYPTMIDPRTIHLCDAFWTASPLGTDSRAGTLIHLISQFTDVAAAQSYAYGQSAARELASTQPHLAVKNSDNFEYFFENTPAIVEPLVSTTNPGSTSTSTTTPATTPTTVALVEPSTTSIRVESAPSSLVPTSSTTSMNATESTASTASTADTNVPTAVVAVKRPPSLDVAPTKKSSMIRVAVSGLNESGPRTIIVERRQGTSWQRLSPTFDMKVGRSVRMIDVRAGKYRVVVEAAGDFPAETSPPVVIRR